METSEDFYMVLPSNSSMTYFPENTTCCFTTHLQREIKLHDEWLVGLVEIHMPCSIVHFQDNEASYTFHTGEEDGRRDTFSQRGVRHQPLQLFTRLSI